MTLAESFPFSGPLTPQLLNKGLEAGGCRPGEARFSFAVLSQCLVQEAVKRRVRKRLGQECLGGSVD